MLSPVGKVYRERYSVLNFGHLSRSQLPRPGGDMVHDGRKGPADSEPHGQFGAGLGIPKEFHVDTMERTAQPIKGGLGAVLRVETRRGQAHIGLRPPD
jgi:hypothetical protein